MKRVLILLAAVILILLLLGGAWFFWFNKAKEGPLTASELVPASASIFLWLPHVPQSLEKFKGTPVYKMWEEQAVQAALAKINPFEQPVLPVPVPEASKKIWELAGPLWGNFQGEAFLAITSFQTEPKSRVESIGGFQTSADPAAFQAWIAQVKTAFPDLKWQEKTYPAQNYFTTEAGPANDKVTLCFAQWQNWVLIGVGEATFQHLLDRAHAGKADPNLSLTGQDAFKSALARQPSGFDALTYVNPAPLVELAKKVLEKQGAKELGSLKVYENMQGIMMTTSIEGPNFRDRWTMDIPKGKRPDYGAAELPLKGSTARFTTPQTLLYSAQNMDPVRMIVQMREAGPDQEKMIDGGLAKVNAALAGVQLNVEKDILPKLGPEFATMLDWGPGKPYPDISFALEHKDQAMLKKLTDFVIQTGQALSGGKLTVNNADIAGDSTYALTFPNIPIVPAIWIGKDMLLFTLNGAALETMVKRTGAGLLDSEAYKTLAASSEIKKPVSMVYVDVEQLLLYSHGALSNIMPMAATMAGQPDLAQALPQVDYLKPYLGHWLMLSSFDDKGVEVEGLFEKGHPYVYAVAGLALSADLIKKLAAISTSIAKARSATPPPAASKEEGSGDIDPNMVLQDLVDLDDAVNSWAKDKNIAVGTPVSWDNITPYLPENSQVLTRVGLDPLGNAYVLGKTGPGQVGLAPATEQHFGEKPPKAFWGKFLPQGELPTATAPAPASEPVPAP